MRLAVSGVLFDLDGTLVDSSGAIARGWTTWAVEHGISADEFAAVGSHGKRSQDLVTALVSPDRAGPALDRIMELELADTEGVVPIPGAAELLAALPHDRWGIVTSGNRPLATARLRAAGLGDAVDRLLVAGDEVSAGKPDPAPYTAGLAALGLAPAECLVVEDAPAGVVSGVAAGCPVLALTTTVGPEQLSAARAVVTDLTAVTVLSDPSGIVLDIAGAPPGAIGSDVADQAGARS